MSDTRIIDFLPSIYDGFSPIFDERIPAESRATCDNCAMVANTADNDKDWVFYRLDTKCCTYSPFLTNYLVGAILTNDALTIGQKRLRSRIEERAVSPAGIKPPVLDRFLYAKSSPAFGRSSTLCCPYYHEQQCSIWPYRNSVCSTWFCKFVAGEDGRTFWRTLQRMVGFLEIGLGQHALLELGIHASVCSEFRNDLPDQLSSEELNREPRDSAAYRRAWGEWVGREEEFYVACYEQVLNLTAAEIEGIVGVPLRIESLMVVEALKEMASETPDLLRRNPTLQIERTTDDAYIISSYLNTDALKVRSKVYQILDYFDGRSSTEVVRQKLADDLRVRVSDGLLRRLFRHRILVSASA